MKIHWIEDGQLAAGGIPVNRADMESLRAQGVRAVISLTEHPLTLFDEINASTLTELGLDYLHVPIDDHTAPTVAQVSQVAQYIDRMKAHNTPIYLHCAAGIGRTGTMLHAYYLVTGEDFDVVQTRVRTAKPSSQFIMLSNAQQHFLYELSRQFKPATQIIETVYFQVLPGKEAEFETAFAEVAEALQQSATHHALHQAVETPGQYLLLIHWRDGRVRFEKLEVATQLEAYLLDSPLVEPYRTVKTKGKSEHEQDTG